MSFHRSPSTDPQVLVAVVGLGAIATYMHLPCLQREERVRLVGGADPQPYQRDRARREFGLPAVYPDAESLLEATHPDAIVVCSPTYSHQGLVAAALEHDCHVLCEKPMGSDPSGAARLRAIAAERGKTLAVAYHNRFWPTLRKAAHVVSSGALGAIHHVSAVNVGGGPHRTWEPKSDWHSDSRAGGALYDVGSHVLDLIRFVTRLDPREWMVHRNDPGEPLVPDERYVAAWTTRSGAIGAAHFGWGGSVNRQAMTVVGERGVISVSPREFILNRAGHSRVTEFFHHTAAARSTAASLLTSKLRPAPPIAYSNQLSVFLDALGGGDPHPLSLDDAIVTLEDLSLIGLMCESEN